MLKRVVDTTVRYVIPGIATVTGVSAWIFAANTSGAADEDFTALVPNDPYPPITLIQEVPTLPMPFDENFDLEVLGLVNCLQDSKRSASALGCDFQGELLDPCYWHAGDAGIFEVFCFDPESYSYGLYEVGELGEVEALWEDIDVEYLIYIEPPEPDNLLDYSDKLVNLRDGYFDLCVIDDFTVPNKIDRTYSCLTGSTITGGILGDRPNYFAEYLDIETGAVSSQWIRYIVYG